MTSAGDVGKKGWQLSLLGNTGIEIEVKGFFEAIEELSNIYHLNGVIKNPEKLNHGRSYLDHRNLRCA